MKKIIPVLLCTSVLTACSDPVERSKEYLGSGKDYYQQDKYDKAKVEFKNALQIDNKMTDAYFHLALIAEKKKNWKAMYGNLMQTIKLAPDNEKARLKLAQLYLLSGEVDKASTEIDTILTKSAGNLAAIAMQGAVYLKQGNYVGALKAADKVLSIDSANVDAISLKTVVYMGQNDFTQAASVIDSALINTPDELSLNLLQLQVYIKAKDDVKIEKTYQNLIQRYADKHDFSYALAQFYISKNRQSEALSVLQNVIDNNKTDIKPKLVLLDYLQATDVSQAESLLKQYMKESPEEVLLYMNLAKVYIAQKKYTEAKEPLNWVVENHEEEKEGLQAKVILAKFAAQDEQIDTALTLVDEVLAVDVRHYEALLLKTRLNLIAAKYDQAITELRGILRDYSDSDEAMVLLAQAYLKKEAPELAEENFRKALDLNPGNFSALMPIVSRMVKSKDLLRADEILNNALKINPNHAGALQAIAQVRLLNKDWQGTQQVVDLISTQPKGKGFSFYLGGKISQGQKAYQEAIDKYKQALELTPTLTDALNSMAVCYRALNQQDKLFAYLDEFMLKHPDDIQAVLLKAKVYSAEKEWNKALAILNKGMEQWPKAPQFYSMMAGIYKAQNNRVKVIESYEAGIAKIPESYQLMLLLASTYEADKNYTKAIEVYDSLITKRPNVDIAVNNLVSLLLDYAPSAENIKRGLTLAGRFSSSKQAYFLDTYGWALLKNDKFKESVEVFKQVNSMMPNIAVFQYHLGFAYFSVNNYAEAEKVLKLAIRSGDQQKSEFLEKDQTNALLNELKTKTVTVK